MKKIQKIIIGLLLLVCYIASATAIASPVDMLNQTANEMLSSLAKNKARLSSPNVIFSIVQHTLIPHIDLNRMAGSVVGRENWLNASASQRQTFIKEFTRLVTSTYSAALSSYDDDHVQFYPVRGDYNTSNSLVVNSVIIRKTGQRISINYNVTRAGNSWKVYDFNIENISMVESYRSQFADILAREGMAGLNQQLIKHNSSIQ